MGNVQKRVGNDKQGKDAGIGMLCPYRNFSQAIMCYMDWLFANEIAGKAAVSTDIIRSYY